MTFRRRRLDKRTFVVPELSPEIRVLGMVSSRITEATSEPQLVSIAVGVLESDLDDNTKQILLKRVQQGFARLSNVRRASETEQ